MPILFELWRDDNGDITFFNSENVSERNMLSEDSKLIWSVWANTWEEAMTLRNEYLGFEPYKPLGRGA